MVVARGIEIGANNSHVLKPALVPEVSLLVVRLVELVEALQHMVSLPILS